MPTEIKTAEECQLLGMQGVALSNEQRARAFLNDMFPEATVLDLAKMLDEAERRGAKAALEKVAELEQR